MAGHAMPHTYSSLLTHIVYSTKDRKPLIDAALESRLFPYLGGIVRQLDGTLYAVNGVEDHIHMLVQMHPSVSVAELVRKIKSNSSRWIRESFVDRSQFAWQRGYGAFTVSKSRVGRVVAYIEEQKSHHEQRSFQDEFIQLLRRHGLPVDERYLWT